MTVTSYGVLGKKVPGGKGSDVQRGISPAGLRASLQPTEGGVWLRESSGRSSWGFGCDGKPGECLRL